MLQQLYFYLLQTKGQGLGDYKMPSVRVCICHIFTLTFISHSFMKIMFRECLWL